MTKVAIIAVENTGLGSLASVMDLFAQAGILWNRIHDMEPAPLFQVEIVTATGETVNTSTKVPIVPHRAMDAVEAADLILIPALVMDLRKVQEVFPREIAWLKHQHANGTSLASLCTGAFLLAATGLCDGKAMTTHWGFVKLFESMYPRVCLHPDRILTDEGDLYSSGGASASINLALYLVEKYCSHEIAVQCSKFLVFDMNRAFQSPFASLQSQQNHRDECILSVQKWLHENFSAKTTVADMADKAGLSHRTFKRRFKKATDDTPMHHLQKLRVEAAKKILETENHTIDEITYSVGYENSSFFRKIFKRYTSLSPNEYRKKFQPMLRNIATNHRGTKA
ncbi:MAG: helix-turn-helix domain-containing protein [Caldithrix sp.]|nr:MAG: helix-turn-helix domain-containing protein [Caldithrix sp.]